jgi:hypothetical protein
VKGAQHSAHVFAHVCSDDEVVVIGEERPGLQPAIVFLRVLEERFSKRVECRGGTKEVLLVQRAGGDEVVAGVAEAVEGGVGPVGHATEVPSVAYACQRFYVE